MNNQNLSKVGLVGMAMGIAETIPGVSGGTIAFIFKIYQELLDTIKSINADSISKLLKGNISGFFKAVNGIFLLYLLIGMGIGIGVGVFGISFLLEEFPLQLWSFFFGLVVASAAYLTKDVEWDWKKAVLFLIGALIAFMITRISPASGSDNLLFVGLCGMIAISALMLPGISGSFILLLLGMYSTVIGSLKEFLSNPGINQELKIISVFALGCLIGMTLFSRVLSFTFKKYFHSTMALMIGVLIGSLNKLWPWRIPNQIMNKETSVVSTWANQNTQELSESYKVLSEITMLPSTYDIHGDSNLLPCVICLTIGVLSIFFLATKSNK